MLWAINMLDGRTPRGVRGLKSPLRLQHRTRRRSHPARGAWIEIHFFIHNALLTLSHPARGAWIEIVYPWYPYDAPQSHPARGAWIEMLKTSLYFDKTSLTNEVLRFTKVYQKKNAIRTVTNDIPNVPQKISFCTQQLRSILN